MAMLGTHSLNLLKYSLAFLVRRALAACSCVDRVNVVDDEGSECDLGALCGSCDLHLEANLLHLSPDLYFD